MKRLLLLLVVLLGGTYSFASTATRTIKEGQTVNVIVNRHPAKSRVTINVNVQSLLNYTVPKITKEEPVLDLTSAQGASLINLTPVTP